MFGSSRTLLLRPCGRLNISLLSSPDRLRGLRYLQFDNKLRFGRRKSTNAHARAPTPSLNLNDEADNNSQHEVSEGQRNWRIAKELGRYVWPQLPDKSSHADERAHVVAMRQRVIASVSLMLAGKAVTIYTPFMFKALVDTLPIYATASSGSTLQPHEAAHCIPAFVPDGLVDILSTSTLAGMPALPAVLLLSYGTSRALSSLFQESRNAVFARVAQSAIRSVGRSTFDHVHSLDLKYHLDRNTGTLGRIIERGNRSISWVLSALVFNTVPTIVEVGVVTGCMGYQFGLSHVSTVLATIGAYVAYTIGITHWRTQFRKDMNSLNNKASGKISDSLLNYETVKYFNNEAHEGRTYEATLRGYQNAALKSQTSLALLNFGQSAIFTVGLTTIMYLTAKDVMAGTATIGDLVLVNGLLFQLSVPLNFIGSVYRETQQCFVDMEAMFGLRDAKSSLVDKPYAVEYNPTKDGCDIEFDQLEFAYTISSESEVTKRPILRGTTFKIPQGKTVAIVGSSGE